MDNELDRTPDFVLNVDPRPRLAMQAATVTELATQLHRDLFGPMDFHDYIVAHHERRAAEKIAREMHLSIARRVAARFASAPR